ncbi:MAG: glyoxalase/bleomycin resistance/dioxygenase family protein [Thermomonas sp.]|uniref:VOC family protein n=1 Tax=Thermomonas sp. TaxID=1971895 RepID=UPI001EB4A48F|nr:VOC family protein [Thermomonas sp.]MBV2209316.1 glyoxalase/bleomycin resistance/dioxygenase family protein [Thermomonas sp.]
MSGPARAGLFIYAKDLEHLASFYQTLLGMSRAHAAPGLVVLRSPDLQITVNAMPSHVAEQVDISSPPARRDNAAYKFFFTVPSLQQASQAASALGGEVLPEQWSGPGFIVCNAVDPEGNIFQVRESAP